MARPVDDPTVAPGRVRDARRRRARHATRRCARPSAPLRRSTGRARPPAIPAHGTTASPGPAAPRRAPGVVACHRHGCRPAVGRSRGRTPSAGRRPRPARCTRRGNATSPTPSGDTEVPSTSSVSAASDRRRVTCRGRSASDLRRPGERVVVAGGCPGAAAARRRNRCGPVRGEHAMQERAGAGAVRSTTSGNRSAASRRPGRATPGNARGDLAVGGSGRVQHPDRERLPRRPVDDLDPRAARR